MTPWIVVSVVAVAVLAVVLVALFVGGRIRQRAMQRPEWAVPRPQDVRLVRFPVVWQGYDPETVDLALDALFESYEELYFAAGPRAIREARENLAVRRGERSAPRLRDQRAAEVEADRSRDVEGELDRSPLHEASE